MTPSAVTRSDAVVPAERGPARRLLEAPASMDAASGGIAQRSVLFRGAAPVDREGYAHISENAWIGVGDEPLSTFSIDVDRASYSNVRRFLRDGMRPPIDAVRIEELVNYFPYSVHLAYSVAAENFIEHGNNRVILATDGDFNVGASSDSEMIRLIEDKREDGTFLTVLGFGTGNLQDAKMEQIADHGNGNFAYIDSELEARKVLVTEMGGTLLTVAKDVKIQVEFNPARVAAYRLIGYENRLLDAQDFNDDSKDAGELGAGHTVTALYEIVPVGIETPAEIPTVDPLRYQRDPRRQIADNEELLFVKLRYKEPMGDVSQLVTRSVADVTHETSDDFRFAAAVAAWGMLLRNSEHCGDMSLADVARMARGAVGGDPEGYRADFLDLLDTARSMDVLEMNPGTE